MMRYEGGAVVWSPSVDELFEGAESPECLRILALFYQFKPGFRALGERLCLSEKLTLFHGNDTEYGDPKGKLIPKHVASVKMKIKNGLFHSHVLVLQFGGYVRVWICSNNIISRHFSDARSNNQEAAYVEDFPAWGGGEHRESQGFGKELKELLAEVRKIESTIVNGNPHEGMDENVAGLLNYNLSSRVAALVVGLHGDGPLNNPRKRLYELTEPFQGRGHSLVLSNSFLTEVHNKVEFFQFYKDFAENARVQRVQIAAASKAEGVHMCNAKAGPGATGYQRREEEDVAKILRQVRYKGKEVGERVGFVHGKSAVCFDEAGRELWALVGGFNFSIKAWGKKLSKETGKHIKADQPEGLEVSVFLDLTGKSDEFLRVHSKFAGWQEGGDNKGLGWTLGTEGVWGGEGEVGGKRKRDFCDLTVE